MVGSNTPLLFFFLLLFIWLANLFLDFFYHYLLCLVLLLNFLCQHLIQLISLPVYFFMFWKMSFPTNQLLPYITSRSSLWINDHLSVNSISDLIQKYLSFIVIGNICYVIHIWEVKVPDKYIISDVTKLSHIFKDLFISKFYTPLV